jgi:small GTP-binding protein
MMATLGVGKTSLVNTYCTSNSGPEYKVSVDVSHSFKCVNVNGDKVNLQLWDIPGHERFGGMTRIHYKVSKHIIRTDIGR